MTAVVAPVSASPRYGPPPDASLRRFSVDEYHQLIASGVLNEHDRCELLEGYIIDKMPRDPVHDATIVIVSELLRSRLPNGWHVRVQSALVTADSEPEPDVVIAKGSPRDYLEHHPSAADAALVVEVANSSLDRDRTIKARINARAGVGEYWIVNIPQRCIERYTQPSGSTAEPAYLRRDDFAEDQLIPFPLGHVAPVPVRELLP